MLIQDSFKLCSTKETVKQVWNIFYISRMEQTFTRGEFHQAHLQFKIKISSLSGLGSSPEASPFWRGNEYKGSGMHLRPGIFYQDGVSGNNSGDVFLPSVTPYACYRVSCLSEGNEGLWTTWNTDVRCLRRQFPPPTNPSFLLGFGESDIVTCLLRRKDGPLLSFIFCWIITLSFFIWPFITDLSVFLSVYTTVPVSHSLSTQGWTHWSHMQSFLSAPIGFSGEWSFSNLEQIPNSLPEPYQQMHLISPQAGISCKKKCCLPPHFHSSWHHTIFQQCTQESETAQWSLGGQFFWSFMLHVVKKIPSKSRYGCNFSSFNVWFYCAQVSFCPD